MRGRALQKAIGFGVLVIVAFVATGPLMGLALGLVGGVAAGSIGFWAYGTTLALLVLVVTWLALRWDAESFAALGLTLDSRRLAELGSGFLATALLFAVCALVRAAAVGASWQFWGAAGVRAAVVGLPITLMLALGEELVFRGYGFRQLVVACGARAAVVLSALAFGLYHLAMAGFRPWGMGAVFVFTLSALGGLLFGAAMIRTRGMALPLGLHLGGNWIQASVLGMGVAAGAQPPALFTAALEQTQVQALTAPDLLPHLPYLLALGTAGLVVAWWPNRGLPRAVA
jgi:membrane protease YdiL (CAAX protease family)